MATTVLFNDGTARTFAGTETINIVPTPGLCRHQLDFGTATTGAYTINVDFGTGARGVETVDMTDSERLPYTVEAVVKAIQAVPAGVTGDVSISYIAVNQG